MVDIKNIKNYEDYNKAIDRPLDLKDYKKERSGKDIVDLFDRT